MLVVGEQGPIPDWKLARLLRERGYDPREVFATNVSPERYYYMTEKRKPAFDARHGRVQVAVWENHGSEGAFYNTTFKVQYKKDGEYHDTDSYSFYDLLSLVRCIPDAVGFIFQKMADRLRGAA